MEVGRRGSLVGPLFVGSIYLAVLVLIIDDDFRLGTGKRTAAAAPILAAEPDGRVPDSPNELDTGGSLLASQFDDGLAQLDFDPRSESARLGKRSEVGPANGQQQAKVQARAASEEEGQRGGDDANDDDGDEEDEEDDDDDEVESGVADSREAAGKQQPPVAAPPVEGRPQLGQPQLGQQQQGAQQQLPAGPAQPPVPSEEESRISKGWGLGAGGWLLG